MRSLTRLVLLLGGRRWIARRLDMALAILATTAARVAENVVAPPAPDVVPTPDGRSANDAALEADHASIHR